MGSLYPVITSNNPKNIWGGLSFTPLKIPCPLKINGCFRCIPYWNSLFLGDMLVFRGVSNGKSTIWRCIRIPTKNDEISIAILVYQSVSFIQNSGPPHPKWPWIGILQWSTGWRASSETQAFEWSVCPGFPTICGLIWNKCLRAPGKSTIFDTRYIFIRFLFFHRHSFVLGDFFFQLRFFGWLLGDIVVFLKAPKGDARRCMFEAVVVVSSKLLVCWHTWRPPKQRLSNAWKSISGCHEKKSNLHPFFWLFHFKKIFSPRPCTIYMINMKHISA